MSNEIRPKTIFLDIDGVIFEHCGDITNLRDYNGKLLPGVKQKINEWDLKGYRIILTTGRKESERDFTISQLATAGIPYDMLIMGIGGGVRVLINDKKLNGLETAMSINLDRNDGLCSVNI